MYEGGVENVNCAPPKKLRFQHPWVRALVRVYVCVRACVCVCACACGRACYQLGLSLLHKCIEFIIHSCYESHEFLPVVMAFAVDLWQSDERSTESRATCSVDCFVDHSVPSQRIANMSPLLAMLQTGSQRHGCLALYWCDRLSVGPALRAQDDSNHLDRSSFSPRARCSPAVDLSHSSPNAVTACLCRSARSRYAQSYRADGR